MKEGGQVMRLGTALTLWGIISKSRPCMARRDGVHGSWNVAGGSRGLEDETAQVRMLLQRSMGETPSPSVATPTLTPTVIPLDTTEGPSSTPISHGSPPPTASDNAEQDDDDSVRDSPSPTAAGSSDDSTTPPAKFTTSPTPGPSTTDSQVGGNESPSPSSGTNGTPISMESATDGNASWPTETPAPTGELVAGQVSGSILIPTGSINSSTVNSLRVVLKDVMKLEDQDELHVEIPWESTEESYRRQLIGMRSLPDVVTPRHGDAASSARVASFGGGVMLVEMLTGLLGGRGRVSVEEAGYVAMDAALDHDLHSVQDGHHAARTGWTISGAKGEKAREPEEFYVRRRGMNCAGSWVGGYCVGGVDSRIIERRFLETDGSTPANFDVTFSNDEGEQTATSRGTNGLPLLLNNTQKVAEKLGLSSDNVSFLDLVYSISSVDDIYTEEALSTFSDSDTEVSAASVVIAAASLLIMMIVTTCLGAIVGRYWLHRERDRRDSPKTKHPIMPGFERSGVDISRTPGAKESPAELRDYAGPLPGHSSQGSRPLLAPSGPASASTEGSGMKTASYSRVPAYTLPGNQTQYMFDPSSETESRPPLEGVGTMGLGDVPTAAPLRAAGGAMGMETRKASAARMSGSMMDVLEHDYGYEGAPEGFADADGAYSEFGGQSEYDSIVPGVQVHDGAASESGSSRLFYDDTHSGWGTDVESVDGVPFTGFPMRKLSSRFSAGPRSQASFAAPSVVASGLSVQSSVTGARSRAQFPPPGGQATSPPGGPGESAALGEHNDMDRVEAGRVNPSGKAANNASKARNTEAIAAGVVPGALATTARQGEAEVGGHDEQKDKGVGSVPENAPVSVPAGGDLEAGLGGDDDGRGRADGLEVVIQIAVDEDQVALAGLDDSANGSAAAGSGDQGPPEHRPGPVDVTGGSANAPALGTDGLSPATAAAASAAAAAAAAENVAGDSPDFRENRPSLDSAAGSVALSSVVYQPTYANQAPRAGPLRRVPRPPTATRDNKDNAVEGSVSVVDSEGEGSRMSAPGKHDDDAASQYAGSMALSHGFGSRRSMGKQDDDAASRFSGSEVPLQRRTDVDADSVEAALKGGFLPSFGTATSSRGPQPMSAMGSSHNGSDGESFVSRVGSYALTDIGTGGSDRDLVGSRWGSGTVGGIFSPASTMIRSAAGTSELESDRAGSPHGSAGYSNGSDSPGGHSAWERAWMRRRDDARPFGGGGGP